MHSYHTQSIKKSTLECICSPLNRHGRGNGAAPAAHSRCFCSPDRHPQGTHARIRRCLARRWYRGASRVAASHGAHWRHEWHAREALRLSRLLVCATALEEHLEALAVRGGEAEAAPVEGGRARRKAHLERDGRGEARCLS